MLQIGSYLATILFAFALVKFETKQHTKQIEDIKEQINTGFKRLDVALNRLTILESDTKSHLDLQEAEQKFVSKDELKLHLKIIENTTEYTKKEVDKMEGKLDDILNLLSSRGSENK